MPPKRKKRNSEAQPHGKKPNAKRARDPSRRKPARSRYQQTITQMNPFFELFHPDSVNGSLRSSDEEDEEQDDHYTSPPNTRKRRRKTPETIPARKIVTRSAKRRAVKAENVSEDEDPVQRPGFLRRRAFADQMESQTLTPTMPPPKTPRTKRRTEIPSSQSPAETPLSIRSRESRRAISRSPLKARSTNTMLPLPVVQEKDERRTRKMQIADSMDTEDDESVILSRINSRISLNSLTPRPEGSQGDGPEARFQYFAIPATGAISEREIPESSQQRFSDHHNSNYGQPDKTHVASNVVAEDEDFNAGLETQASLAELGLSLPNSNQRGAFGLFSTDLVEFEPETVEDEIDSPQQVAAENAENFPHNSEAFENSASNVASSPKILDTYTTVSQSPDQHSYPASAQLQSDLRRATQRDGLETESQFEGAWKSYHPGDNIDQQSDVSDLLLSSEEIQQPCSSPMTVPTQLLPPQYTTQGTPSRNPVPPSQATTVDSTQPSPHKMPSLSQRMPVKEHSPTSSSTLSSSTPPLAPPTSSQETGGKPADPLAGYEWDGVRLSESQLLPESLMQDSLQDPLLDLIRDSSEDELW